MTMINLDQDWRLGPQLFEGGFGRLYSTESACGHGAVVKLVPKMPGGDRELLFVNLSGTPNVMPILDYGEWEDFWVLVMPRADKSLREHLTSCGGPLPEVEAVEILKDIIRALAALNGDVVHRDLKPENVLFYQDAWCLADFGIARYAELTTATETWKYAKTKEYAAPEQWRGERATGATDVYATGVMAYELLAGERPFGGPQEHDYRDQHLHEEAPGLTGCRAALASLVAECLYKSPKARPTAENIQGRLEGIGLKVSASGQRLQQADQRAAQQRSGDEALASAAQSVAEERDSLARTAEQSLERMLGALRDRVRDLAPGSHLRGAARPHGLSSWWIRRWGLVGSAVQPLRCLTVPDIQHRLMSWHTPASMYTSLPTIGAMKGAHILCGSATQSQKGFFGGMRLPLCLVPFSASKARKTLSRWTQTQ